MKQPLNVPTDVKGYELYASYVCPITGICVPKGFKYDGASIPRVLWSLVGMRPDGLNRAAALVHDWCYVNGGIVTTDTCDDLTLTKKDADRLFRDLLIKANAKKLRTKLAYIAVRWFGRGSF